jgi:hypothetical protein
MGATLSAVYASGIILELKKSGVTVFKKDGTLRKNEQLELELSYMQAKSAVGYIPFFAIGYDAAIEVINWYFDIT